MSIAGTPRPAWRRLMLIGAGLACIAMLQGCILTEVREDTGRTPLQDATDAVVRRAVSGDLLGAIVGGVGTLIGGAGAIAAQRQRRKGREQIAQVVRGIAGYVENLDKDQAATLYAELRGRMDRQVKLAVKDIKAKEGLD